MKRTLAILLCLCMAIMVFIPSYALIYEQKDALPRENSSIATESITLPITTEGLVLNKTLSEPDGNGIYTVTLEAYAKGVLNVITTEEYVPADIILVLDQSGSMDYTFESGSTYTYTPKSYSNNLSVYNDKNDLYVQVGDKYYALTITRTETSKGPKGYRNYEYTYSYFDGSGNRVVYTTGNDAKDNSPPGWSLYKRFVNTTTTTRRQALKDAATAFVEQVKAKSISDNVNHRIAIVGFASGYSYGYDILNYENTELFIGSNTYRYGTSAANQYANAFQNMNTTAGYNNVLASINSLDSEGGTMIHLGLEMANGIMGANPIPTGVRNRIVVVLTDGEPGWNGYDEYYANLAISEAYTAKNTYKSKVYSIGIFPEADPAGGTNATNMFMHYISSNYPNAQSTSNTGTGNKASGYYLAASNTTALNQIFQTISSEITSGGSLITLGADAIVKDILSDYFNWAPGIKNSDIKVYTQDYLGSGAWGERIPYTASTISIEGDTINVSNFDFSANYVADANNNTAVGKKLVIDIPVDFDESSTFGGVGIPSNDDYSGVYSGETIVGTFIPPTINAPIRYDFASMDQTIYLGTNADFTSLFDFITDYIPDGLKNTFVNIVYTVTHGADTIGVYTIPPGEDASSFNPEWWVGNTDELLYNCDTYSVNCTVSPLKPGVDNRTQNKDATIHVLSPVITFKDLCNYFGSSIDLSSSVVSADWSDINGHTGTPIPITSEPTKTYLFGKSGTLISNPDNFSSDTDEDIDVNVILNGTDYTNLTTFIRQACDYCLYVGDTHTGTDNMCEFVVHIKACSLTITKTGAQDIDENQTFIFNVSGPEGSYIVAIQGNGSKTITGLPIGEYTISEDTGWSWRYTPEEAVKHTSISESNLQASVQFNNTRTNKYWLSGDSFAINLYAIAALKCQEE